MLKKDEYPKFEGHFGEALNPDTYAGAWGWKQLAHELYEACLNAHDNHDTDSLKEILKHLKPVFEYKNKGNQSDEDK